MSHKPATVAGSFEQYFPYFNYIGKINQEDSWLDSKGMLVQPGVLIDSLLE